MVKLDEDIGFWKVFVLTLKWDHWEWDSLVTLVGVEDSLEGFWVSNLILVHFHNSLANWKNMIQLDLRESLEDSSLDVLDFGIKSLDLIGTSLVKSFVEKRNILELENLVALVWELLKETGDSTWMDDLVTWAESQVKE